MENEINDSVFLISLFQPSFGGAFQVAEFHFWSKEE